MLTSINETILNSMTPRGNSNKDEMTDIQAELDLAAYNPNEERSKWNNIWKQDVAHRDFVESRRNEYSEELRLEAESKGHHYDYYAVAYERFPSPPPIEYPDDITFMDDNFGG